MLKNNFKLILRNLWKNKVISSINLLGLTLGIACSLLLLLYVQYEYAHDDFMKDKERIYRLAGEQKGANPRKIGLSGQEDVDDLSQNYASVEAVVQLRNNRYNMIPEGYPEKKLRVDSWYASENFFDFFGFPLVEGDPEKALSDPSSVVITLSAAERLFGDENPIGKTLTIDASSFKKELVVTGIAEDRDDSHIKFEAIIPWSMKAPDGRHIPHMWFQRSLYTYIKTAGVGQIEDITTQKNQALVESGGDESWEYFFQALGDIYLGSNDIQFLAFDSGNAQTVQTLFYIAIIILLVACINYVNLQTAKGTRRSLEVGVRKVMGAHRGQLIRQFLSESTVLTVFAALLAVLLIDLALPAFNALTGKSFTTLMLMDQGLIPFLVLITVVTALVSGLYPAFVLSSFKPTAVLKSSSTAGLSGRGARRTLMLMQFGISIFLISVTAITYQQTAFINNKDLGFNKEQVITFRITTRNMRKSYPAFRQELDQYTGIAATSLSTDVLGSGFTNNSGPVFSKINPDLSANTTIFGVDHRFVQTYDMEMALGRDFDIKSSYDSGALIVNEALVKSLGLDDPLNSKLAFWDPNREGLPIIGVVKDFHFQKLHQQINPVALRISPRNIWNLSVRMKPENIAETLDFIESKWNEFEPEAAFDYSFIDQEFARFYENETQMQKAVTFFSLVSIILTSLGLLGMCTFVIERKLKEIGVRKILGATVGSINLLVFREFLLVFVLALLVACPLAVYLGGNWLNRFAYRIDINALPFLLAGLLTLTIIAATVTILTRRAATNNPMDALRNE